MVSEAGTCRELSPSACIIPNHCTQVVLPNSLISFLVPLPFFRSLPPLPFSSTKRHLIGSQVEISSPGLKGQQSIAAHPQTHLTMLFPFVLSHALLLRVSDLLIIGKYCLLRISESFLIEGRRANNESLIKFDCL